MEVMKQTYSQVVELLDEGLTLPTIAEMLDIPVDLVEDIAFDMQDMLDTMSDE